MKIENEKERKKIVKKKQIKKTSWIDVERKTDHLTDRNRKSL